MSLREPSRSALFRTHACSCGGAAEPCPEGNRSASRSDYRGALSLTTESIISKPMYNLYSITTNQESIARLFRKVSRYIGNLAPMPGVFPDYPLPNAFRRQGPRMQWRQAKNFTHGTERSPVGSASA